MKAAAVAVLLVAGSAFGQATPIGPFVGDFQEGFEAVPGYACPPCFVPSLDCFGGNADCIQVGGSQGLHITSGWGWYFTIFPHSGGLFMAGTYSVIAEWVFDTPAKRFGGYFGTNANEPNGTAMFYDQNGNLIDTEVVTAPQGSWAWNGWEAAGAPFKKVQILGGQNGLFGHLMHDDLELSSGSSCYPDCEEDGDLDVFDFLCFQGAFANQAPYADCEQDGDWDVFDFLCFQGAFASGCN